MASKKTPRTNARVNTPRIRLIGYSSEDRHPDIAAYLIDRSGKPVHRLKVDAQGRFELADKQLDKAAFLAIGADTGETSATLDRKHFVLYRPTQVRAILARDGRFEIPRERWLSWIKVRRCVSGSVRHCHWHFFPWPWPLPPLTPLFSVKALAASKPSGLGRPAKADVNLPDSLIAYPRPPRPPHRHCRPLCDGLIEVYRRTCCCTPWIIHDPRLDDLLAELERLSEGLRPFPPKPWPPRPEPDPSPLEPLPPIAAQGPFAASGPTSRLAQTANTQADLHSGLDPLRLSLLRNGTPDERQLNAARDLAALQRLPAEQVPAYINARPYIACRCGHVRKMAQGFIRADGEFSLCWREPLRLLRPHCHDEYSFVVKQVIDDETVTIYNGLAANRWHTEREGIVLDSYHPRAATCGGDDFPGDAEGAFALLQDIGLTGSWLLKTPDARAWDRVDPPVEYNDGLAFPAATPDEAVGRYLDRNWGGLLRLRYHFSAAMKSLGARYFRVSVVAADDNGDPIGPRRYLAAPPWHYYEYSGTTLYVRKQALGPHSAGGQNDLYEIPLPFDDVDKSWQSGQYHALLDTREFANGRHLLTLEVFDASGTLLRPQVSDAPPIANSPADFTFRRWYQETGATDEVPHGALTHLLWWDNRRAVAHIADLRVAGVASNEECQFLTASGATGFSIGYRAYHPEPLFLLDHRLWSRRGLGGPVRYLTVLDPAPDANPNVSPRNVGVPPAPVQQGQERRFDDMLDGVPSGRCSFSANLHVNVKTFDGIGTLDGLDGWDQAAFALELTS